MKMKIVFYCIVIIAISCNSSKNGEVADSKVNNYRLLMNNYISELNELQNENDAVKIIEKYYYSPDSISPRAMNTTLIKETKLSKLIRNGHKVQILIDKEIDDFFGPDNAYLDPEDCECNAVILLDGKRFNEYCLNDDKIFSSIGIYHPEENDISWARELYTKEELDSLGLDGK